VVNDPNDGEVTWIGLAAGGLPSCGAPDADHPVPRLGANGINSDFLGAAVLHHLKMFVLKIRNPIGRDQGFDDLDDEHDQ
jgi:hypothetical protein